MNLIQQQWKSQSEFVRVIEFTKNEISKWKRNVQNGGSVNEGVAKDVITNSLAQTISTSTAVDLKNFLLAGPEMTDEQFYYIQEKRKHFNEWK
jgi:hypothetical protein